MSPIPLFLMSVGVLAYALIGGVFLAFSDFIMRSLSRTRGVDGIEAMQVINREVFRWVFMTLFLGMAAGSFLIGGYAAIALEGPAAAMFVAAGAVYVIGCFGVTVVFNVPMNNALARMDVSSEETVRYWTGTYLPRWTFWNTVRTFACVASAALLMSGLLWVAWTPAT